MKLNDESIKLFIINEWIYEFRFLIDMGKEIHQ